MITELMVKLDRLRGRTARFRPLVLHVHSPDSEDWATHHGEKSLNDRTSLREPQGRKRYLEALGKHFSLVAVTDHMRCGYACDLSSIPDGEATVPVVLPGMEVNLRADGGLIYARIHLLTILPEGSCREDFACLFADQDSIPNDDESRRGRHEVTGVDIKDWVKRVEQAKGLCIAAHVESDQGVRRHLRQASRDTLELFDPENDSIEADNAVGDNVKAYLLNSGVHAIEIHKEADVTHYKWTDQSGRIRRIPTLLTFDAHCIEHFERPERATHIKMTHVGIKGLKEALRFSDTRIRYRSTLPEAPAPRLLGIQVSGGDQSFFEDITVAFAENLTCLIGARGSGKSTLVEALRYAFGKNRELGRLDDKLQKSIVEMQGHNLDGTVIRVAYSTQERGDLILEATFDAREKYTTKIYTAEGEYVPIDDLELSGDFPLRLFGWSEVESLGQDASRQRDLLDRLIPDLSEPLHDRTQLRSALASSRDQIRAIVRELEEIYEENDGELRRYREYREEFAKFNTDEVKTLFSALDLVQLKREVLDQVSENVETLVADLSKLESLSVQEGVSELIATDEDIRNWWNTEELEKLGLMKAEEGVRASVAEARARLNAFNAELTAHRESLQTESEDLTATITEGVSGDATAQSLAERRQNAGGRLKRVSEIRERYVAKFEEMTEALRARRETAEELVSCQQRIAGIRAEHHQDMEARLNSFLPPDMKVSIDFKAGGDRKNMGPMVYGIYGKQGHSRQRIIRVAEECCTPVKFAAMLLDGDVSELVGKGTDEVFAEEDALRCVDECQPFSTDTAADVKTVALKKEDTYHLDLILDLQETEWDDYAAILLNGGPVNEKSPGQRSSAMLPLIALTETTPLIIDQPEDNLDKRLIGNVLINILAALKEKRQIIVCTHDPNILVGGDAEQVAVLEAESDKKGKVLVHGSIDNEDIVKTVIDLLEGGREAFEARQMRYDDLVAP